MTRNIFLLSILFFIKYAGAINVDGRHSSREGKVFSLFNIVKFENAGCESTLDTVVSGNKRNGTCYASSECGDKGGSSKGSCAAGFGVCCVFVFNTKTNTEVSYNNTYLQNPGYPTGYTGTEGISYTVKKCNDNICYLRIDFEDFSIYGPSNSVEYDEGITTWTDVAISGGKCADDTFIVTAPSSSSFTVPTICGKNTGEHIYIPMGDASTDSATIAFSFTNEHTRTYDLKLSQIECGDTSNPPDGCLQYFTGTSGKIRTFNFQDATKTTTHLALQNYQVCMRKEDGYCCNQYTVCDETDSSQMNSFSLYPEKTKLYSDQDTFANVVSKCTQDYITIPGGQSVCSTNPSLGGFQQTKFCGSKFNVIGNQVETATNAHIPVCACGGLFTVGIHTDDTADDADPATATAFDWSRGACLDFKQQPC